MVVMIIVDASTVNIYCMFMIMIVLMMTMTDVSTAGNDMLATPRSFCLDLWLAFASFSLFVLTRRQKKKVWLTGQWQ